MQIYAYSWIHLKCLHNTSLAKQDISDTLWKVELRKKSTGKKKKNLPILSSPLGHNYSIGLTRNLLLAYQYLVSARHKQHRVSRNKENADSPAIVTTHSPDSDAHYGLWMKNCTIHGVDQVQHVIFQYQVHVFALQLQKMYSYRACPPLKLIGIKEQCLHC